MLLLGQSWRTTDCHREEHEQEKFALRHLGCEYIITIEDAIRFAFGNEAGRKVDSF